MEKEIESFSILSIANWNKENNLSSDRVELPKLQRGFVWKNEQISNLWDSILRGFPIGSFLIAVNKDQQTKELLDGQQRSTSILTGFYSQFKDGEKGVFSLKRFPSIWIDIHPNAKPLDNEFSIHVLTQSHPWGFLAANPSKSLGLNYRRDALTYFNSIQCFTNYLEIEPQHLVPWDSVCPIPLCFILELLDINSLAEFKRELAIKLANLKVSTNHKKEIVYAELLQDEDFEKLYRGLNYAKQLIIPQITIDVNAINGIEPNTQNPTLFLRLNAGGTKIGGEELIYSIFKSHFPLCKNLVEEISANYIAPSKLISLFARLVLAKTQFHLKRAITFNKSIDLKNFNQHLKDDFFRKSLENLIENTDEAKLKFELITNLFECRERNFVIPKVLIKKILGQNVDLIYVLLVYFEINQIKKIEQLSPLDYKAIINTIFKVIWFSVDKAKTINRLFQLLVSTSNEKQDDLATNLLNSLETLTTENYIYPIIEPKLLQSIFDKIIDKKLNFYHIDFKENIIDLPALQEMYSLTAEEDVNKLRNFIKSIYNNKDLLLLAQKEYIISEFEEFNQVQSVEDTNVPWDWDHIFPKSWSDNRKNVNPLVRQWVHSIGNLRALSVGENRKESNKVSPKDRLEQLESRSNGFIDDVDYKELWSKFNRNDIKITDNANELLTPFLRAVLTRTRRIYGNFYNIMNNL